MLNRTIAPPIKDAVTFSYHLQPCNKSVLNNGIPLYWLSAGTQDVVQIEWVFKAGLWEENQVGVAQATAALMKNGTSARSAIQINEALEYYGASLRVSATNDFNVVTLHTLTKHLPVLLPVVQEVIFDPVFPDEEVALYIQNSLQRLKVNLEKTEFIANRNIDAFLFGKEHPYGRFTEEGDLRKIDAGVLRAFFKKYFTARNCRIFMSGNLNQEHVDLVKNYFGNENWGMESDRIIPEFELRPAVEKKYRMQIDQTVNVQGSIRLGRTFPKRNHPDFTPMIVLNTLFGGYFGSRLMANIREEKGYTYGIYSHLYSYREAGALMIATEAGTSVCEAAIQEVYKEMEILCAEQVSEEELLLVKNYLLGNLLGDLDGPFSLMQRWKSMILFELPEDSFDKNIEIYKNISAAEIKTLAQKYFQKENYFELVVS